MKGRGTKEIEQLKIWVLKYKKRPQMCFLTEKNIYTNQEHLPTEVNPDIDFTDEQV